MWYVFVYISTYQHNIYMHIYLNFVKMSLHLHLVLSTRYKKKNVVTNVLTEPFWSRQKRNYLTFERRLNN